MSDKKDKTEIVIVGAGIVGVCSAYYLTQHPKFNKETHHITIFEAKRPACAASGKAGGLLALWAFPQQIASLSFDLHQELADELGGEKEWGYRRVTTVSLEGNLQNSMSEGLTSPPDGKSLGKLKTSVKKPADVPDLPQELDWIISPLIDEWASLGTTETTAQVHPFKFTNYLLKKVLESGAADLILTKVTGIIPDPEDPTGACKGVKYTESATGKQIKFEADQVLLTVGPWTNTLLPSCPIDGLRAHSITIAPTRQVSPYALFTELKVRRGKYVSPEIYPRKDEVYVCGEGDGNAPVPDNADEVEVERSRCDDLFKYASAISPELSGGRVLRRQACYLPVVNVASCPGPFIGPTNIDNLFLASGHSCWGINNAPATGKIMSEILLEGRPKSASIQGLEPDIFFDASDFTT